jgi:hypothetical protein
MDDSAIFIITIFVVVLLFLNFYYVSYRNDQFIMASLRTLDRTINLDLTALRADVVTNTADILKNTEDIATLDGRVADIENATSLDIIHGTTKLLSDLNAGYAIMKTNNEKILETFYDFNDKLKMLEKQMSEQR